MSIEEGRVLLEEWAKLDPTHEPFISEVRFRFSHDRWPKKTEGKLSFGFDYYTLPTKKWEVSTLVDKLNQSLQCARRAVRVDIPADSFVVTEAKQIIEANVHEIRNSREMTARHPDSLRKWTDPKKTLYDGTRVWNDDASPAVPSLAEQHNAFMQHEGNGQHDYIGLRRAYKNYQAIQARKQEMRRLPKNREKTPQEVAEYLALKNQQRETSRKQREALDEDERRQFEEAKKRRHKARQ